ncbi:MAG TPA: hypothetical protein VMX75_14070 [Spirochaetia bacterium]|nr:hypothetical protein [Acidobacteriota bacterium]HUV08854.1 hypothetical protein [Spirochaetia bacterium]
MHSLLDHLPAKERRGSKPRCHLLTHGSQEQVAARLTGLIDPWGQVNPHDKWMPQGFDDLKEAQLHDAPQLLADSIRTKLQSWWLAVPVRATTPNWDIASTCTIDGKGGLLLIEAKGHDTELLREEKGKTLDKGASENSRRNHDRIGKAIGEAKVALNSILPGWNLSRDSHYQLANRFAWGWKLIELGLPVILVYLGFLNAEEMRDLGKPFAADVDWQRLVRSHSKALVPDGIWNQKWELYGQPFIPLIRSIEWPLDTPPENDA